MNHAAALASADSLRRRLRTVLPPAGAVRRAGVYVPLHVLDHETFDVGPAPQGAQPVGSTSRQRDCSASTPPPSAADIDAFWVTAGQVCAITGLVPLTSYFPQLWQRGRDFLHRERDGALLILRSSLPVLVADLSVSGHTHAAAALLVWLTDQSTAGSGGTASGSDRVATRQKTATPARQNWVQAWEARQDA